MAYKTPNYLKIAGPDETVIEAGMPIFIAFIAIIALLMKTSCPPQQ